MNTELEAVKPTAAVSLFDMKPKQMTHFATEIADELMAIVEKQKLYTVIQGKKHVRIEGWSTLGSFLGVVPREVSVLEYDDGSYEAKVELFSTRNGQIVGQASSICSVTEARWGKADKFARRSMAITRATGKAYRLGFSWIMTLAGYEATPYEEMPDEPKVVSKKSEGYDPENKAQNSWLTKELEKRNVDKAHWDSIGQALRGKSATELEKTITTVVGAH